MQPCYDRAEIRVQEERLLLKSWKRKLARAAASAVFAGAAIVAAPLPAEASSGTGWGIAASALSGFIAYKSGLSMMLDIGNNAHYQQQSLWQDKKANGTDGNARDVAIVDGVMTRLTQPDVFVLPADALPFSWHVNDSALFNAACYPTDYISVNRGLVRILGHEAEIAAVLGHEMTHGIEHHSAEVYAKTMAAYYGLSLLNMATGVMDWQQLQKLTAYSSAKLFTLPTEYAADAGGFSLAARAGFNPGGGAAAMARMTAYLKDESRDFREYQDPKEKTDVNYNDHPDTELREARLMKMLTDYSAGHVTVADRKDVCIDGTRLLSGAFTAETYDDTAENAYLLAGELGRLFHDCRTAEAWGLGAAGDWENAKAPLLAAAVRQQGLKDTLRTLVTAAYAGEEKSGARKKLDAAEAKERQALAKAYDAVLAANAKQAKRMRMNSDIYSDLGDSRKALAMIDRALAAKGLDDHAESLGIRGRALAVAGDFDGALQTADAACAEDPKNVYNFLNRADIYWMKGDLAAAIADAAQAVAADEKNADGYLMRAILTDEAGDCDGALADYQKVHELAPAFERIPDEYLKDIDAKAYDARVKKREEAAKAAAEEKKKAAEARKTDEQQQQPSTEKPQKEQKTTEKNEK